MYPLFRLKENEEKAHTLEEEKQQFDEQAQELNETIKVMLIGVPVLPGLISIIDSNMLIIPHT